MKNYADLLEEVYGDLESDFKSIHEFLANLPAGTVAEIGAGSGRLLKAFSRTDRDFILVEPSADMRATLSGKTVSYQILPNYSYQLPFQDQSIAGIIYAFGSIAEMHPQFFSLSEASRSLLEGGKLYILTVNPKIYRTPAMGLNRSIDANLKSSMSSETIPAFHRGNFEYDAVITNRVIGSYKNYIVEQICPPVQWWDDILASLNLEVENIFDCFSNNPFMEDSSRFFHFVAKKISPEPVRHPTEDFYNSIASKYDEIWPVSEYRIPDWLNGFFRPFKSFHPRILDLGCGSGIVGEILKELNLKPCFLFGIDVSEQMVAETRKKDTYTAVARYDLNKGLPDKKANLYDVVTACGLFEFLVDKRPLLKDILVQLDIGGFMVASFEACEASDSNTETVSTPLGTIIRYRLSEKALSDLLEEVGFKITKLKKTIGYKSPTTGKLIDYFLVEAKKIV